RRRHTRSLRDWSSDVCSSDLTTPASASTCGTEYRSAWSKPRPPRLTLSSRPSPALTLSTKTSASRSKPTPVLLLLARPSHTLARSEERRVGEGGRGGGWGQ